MANTTQAAKRARQAVKRRAHNMALRSVMRTSIKKVRKAIAAGNRDEAQVRYREAVPVIDSMVTKGIVHKNQAARHKSRLNNLLKSMT